MVERLHGLDAEEKLMNHKITDPETGCWRWTRQVHANGYGIITIGKRNQVLVHRIAYRLWVGPIPEGYQIDHVYERGCRYRDCINPMHLEAVTQRENLMRGRGVPAMNARKTHCQNGHEFTPENTMRSGPGRRCHTCHLAWRRRAYRDGRRG